MAKINLSREIPCRAQGIKLDPVTQRALTRERHLYRKALKLVGDGMMQSNAEALVNGEQS